jgi:hypothetical protein
LRGRAEPRDAGDGTRRAGRGAALLQANSIALVSTPAPRRRLRAALGRQAGAQAVGLALGPTAGGGLAGLLPAGLDSAAEVPTLAGVGLGLGVFIPANNALIMGGVPSRAAALTGGLVSAARAVGTASGVAIVSRTLSIANGGGLTVAVLIAVVVLALASIAGPGNLE